MALHEGPLDDPISRVRQDIDFAAIAQRLSLDLNSTNIELERAKLLSEDELEELLQRQRNADKARTPPLDSSLLRLASPVHSPRQCDQASDLSAMTLASTCVRDGRRHSLALCRSSGARRWVLLLRRCPSCAESSPRRDSPPSDSAPPATLIARRVSFIRKCTVLPRDRCELQ